MTWNESKPALANQISADIPDIWENFDELRDIIETLTTGTVGTTASGDFIARAHTFVNNANGNPNISDTPFSLTGSITESTWESVGPTDSGMDNIWTELDSVPSGVDWIEVDITVDCDTGPVDTQNTLKVYVRKNGGSEAIGKDNMVVFVADRADGSGDCAAAGVFKIKVPVASRAFDAYWVSSFTTVTTLDLKLAGYGYNS